MIVEYEIYARRMASIAEERVKISRLDIPNGHTTPRARLNRSAGTRPEATRSMWVSPTYTTPHMIVTQRMVLSSLQSASMEEQLRMNVSHTLELPLMATYLIELFHQYLQQYSQIMEERVIRLLGVPRPIERETLGGFEESPFTVQIARSPIL